MTPMWRYGSAAGLALLLSGCNLTESYERAGAWHPTGVNTVNLAAMTENPLDLVHGNGTAASDGTAAAAAVDRLRHDHVKSLLDGTSTSATPSSAAGLAGN
jgi:type IV pilus biogenesis protein CpaD/CtpE